MIASAILNPILMGALLVASGEAGIAHISLMYEQIPLSCACGRQPTRLREVGLTADRQLVIYWRCSDCRRHMYIVKPLTECMRDCPDEDRIEAEPAMAENVSSFQMLEHHQKA